MYIDTNDAAGLKTILLVENDAIISTAKKNFLAGVGYRVMQAFDGRSAVEIVSSNPGSIDLVLMDIDLGKGIDGIEAAREIQGIERIPVIFLSSYIDERIMTVESYGFVNKNSCASMLALSVKTALNRHAEHMRMRYELELSENRENYRLLYEVGFNGMVISDGGIAVDANHGCCQMFGFEKKEIIGKDIIELIIHENHRAAVLEIVNGENRSPHRALFRGKDGIEMWMDYICLPYLLNRKRMKVIAIRGAADDSSLGAIA